MEVLGGLNTAALAQANGGALARLTLDAPLPARTTLPAQATVLQSKPDGSFTLQLPDGRTVSGNSQPPLQQGAQLQLSLPQGRTAAQTNVLTARVLTAPAQAAQPTPPAATPNQPVPTPQAAAPVPTVPTPLPVAQSVMPLVHSNVPVQLLPQAATPQPVPVPVQILSQVGQPQVSTTVQNLMNTIQLGNAPAPTPVNATVLAPVATPPSAQPLQGAPVLPLPTTSAQTAPQQYVLQLAVPTAATATTAAAQPAPTMPLQVVVQSPQSLSVGQAVQLVPAAVNQQSVQLVPQQSAPQQLLTQPPMQVATINLASGGQTVANAPQTPVPLAGANVQLLPSSATPPSPVTAIVSSGPQLAAPQTVPAKPELLATVPQTVTLASGQNATLNTPQALPLGTVMVIRFNVAGTGEVLQLTNTVPDRNPQTPLPQQGAARSATPQAPVLTPGQQYQGQVIGQHAGNMLQLRLQGGQEILVQAQRPFPVGTQMTLQVTSEGQIQVVNLAVPAAALQSQSLGQFTNQWPALVQALNVLQQESPKQSAQLGNNIPQLKNLLGRLPQFMHALQHGNLEQWVGKELASTLRSMGFGLETDIAALQQLQQQPQRQENTDHWRALLFPYVEDEGDQPRQGQFYWREQEKEDGSTSQRFVLAVELSELGPVQLDGLFTTPEVHIRLRLEQELSDNEINALSEIVADTLRAFELHGEVRVEVVDKLGEPEPLHDLLKTAQGEYNVTT